MNMHYLKYIISIFLISGCTSIVEKVSDGPIEETDGSRTLGQKVEDESIEFNTKYPNLQTRIFLVVPEVLQ